jgi:predicted O-linked N-acetylglucosamine transferase (SPINDLY family)
MSDQNNLEDREAEEESLELEESEVLEEEEPDLQEELDDDEVEFDLEAQIELFRNQIEEEPENCIHHYNLGEALEELRHYDEALEEFQLALKYDEDNSFGGVIHFGLGSLYYNKLLSGASSDVIKSSIGLLNEHKAKDSITDVLAEDYQNPINEFEQALKYLPMLKADDDLAEYISETAPLSIANIYYKWASDLVDKSRQIANYGDEINDIKRALKHLKKVLEIDPNNSPAALLEKLGKKMLAEGWMIYDEYGFEAKNIQGIG